MHLDSHNRITLIELVAIGTLTYTAFTPEKHSGGQLLKAHTASLLPTITPQAM
jgi:hypothetical protein